MIVVFNNKNLIKKLIVLLFLVFIFVICIICVKCNEQKIVYSDTVQLNYNDFTKHFSDRYDIKIKNDSDNVRVYSIKWIDIKNTVLFQNKFLYELTCEDIDCKEISPSQMPVSGFNLIHDIFVEPKSEIIYSIRITYKGKADKKGSFKGQLVSEKGVTDQIKYEDYMKQRESKQKFLEKATKEMQDLDDK